MSQGNTLISTCPQKTIFIDDKELQVQDGETVLEALERAGYEANYNCREGFCGVCRTKLLAGSVEYKVDPLAFIDEDEILSCCTTPSSDIKIKVEY